MIPSCVRAIRYSSRRGCAQNGVQVREILYPGVSHLMLVGSLAAALRGYAPVLDDVAEFVRA